MSDYSMAPHSASSKETLLQSRKIVRETQESVEFTRKLRFEHRLAIIETQEILAESYALLRRVHQPRHAPVPTKTGNAFVSIYHPGP